METLYLYCAIFGSVFVVVNLIVALIGLGGDSDVGDTADTADATIAGADSVDSADLSDTGQAHGNGGSFLRAFSIRSLAAGVAFFGLGGLASSGTGLDQTKTFVVAALCGLAAMYFVYYLMRSLTSFNYDGSIRLDTAVGSSGTVYLRIPGKRAGIGKASVIQQGRTMEYEALTDYPEDLPAGMPIVVVKLLNCNQALVEPKKD